MDPLKTGIFSQDSAFLQHYQTANRRTNVEQQGNASSVESKSVQETTKLLAQSAMKPSIKAEPMWYGGPQGQSVQVIRGAHGSILGTRMSTGITAGRTSLVNPYIRKWRRLKRVIKDLVYVNAAVCDEVVRVEEKIAKVKEERRFLLRKLLHYQSLADGGTPQPKVATTTPVVSKAGTVTSNENAESSPSVKSKPKAKKKLAASTAAAIDKKKITVIPPVAKEILDAMQPKSKKSKASQVQRKFIPPLQLDSSGRPIFPLVIGDLTVHSIGEIVSDRPGFHSTQCIYPEGFCSTRSYASTLDPTKPCLYTCKISDGGNGPVFEIDAEDNPDFAIQGSPLSECHSALIKCINKACGGTVLESTGDGATFFGLTHPVVQNLIQSCPGARRCSGYKWVKFEISKTETAESVSGEAESDPSISFESFKALFGKGGTKSQSATASLRSLLTSKELGVKKK
ncbi:hypothetical protein FSP39_015162 [Pinctada imbricata]|uniref:INO80 complex subunit E N-terminal domain-containing protein n=1 Tax=Pinctada imbricata TaxID=66713 RepID=A0AA88Y9H0_PINIB|nr:hypothetical protein FSP39_015162 [Pinctada imbricata]